MRAQQPGRGLDHHVGAAGFLEQEPAHATGCVAAGARLRTVGVADAHEDVGAFGLRGLKHNQLVAADAPPAVGDQARLAFAERKRPGACVDDDEIVAEPVHLDECRACDGRARGHRRLIWGRRTGVQTGGGPGAFRSP